MNEKKCSMSELEDRWLTLKAPTALLAELRAVARRDYGGNISQTVRVLLVEALAARQRQEGDDATAD